MTACPPPRLRLVQMGVGLPRALAGRWRGPRHLHTAPRTTHRRVPERARTRSPRQRVRPRRWTIRGRFGAQPMTRWGTRRCPTPMPTPSGGMQRRFWRRRPAVAFSGQGTSLEEKVLRADETDAPAISGGRLAARRVAPHHGVARQRARHTPRRSRKTAGVAQAWRAPQLNSTHPSPAPLIIPPIDCASRTRDVETRACTEGKAKPREIRASFQSDDQVRADSARRRASAREHQKTSFRLARQEKARRGARCCAGVGGRRTSRRGEGAQVWPQG